MIKKILLSILLGIGFYCNGLADSPSQEIYPCEDVANNFFQLAAGGKYEEATDVLLRSNPKFFSDWEAKMKVKMGLENTAKNYGTQLFAECVAKKKVGTRIVYFRYAVFYSSGVSFYEIAFYRPKDEWMFFQINFDVDVMSFVRSQ